MATASSFNDSSDSCMRCSSKYNRIQPSLCQCKHCSESFCFDCMKEHNDEIQQNRAELTDQYNQVKQSMNDKKELIRNETIKAKQELSEWFKIYIDKLSIAKERIDMDIDKEEKQTQNFFSDIESELQTCVAAIQSFTKTNTFKSAETEKLFNKLKEFKQQIDSLIITKEYDLPSAMPEYAFKLDYSSKIITDDTQQISTIFNQQKSNTDNQPNIKQSWQANMIESEKKQATEDKPSFVPDENYFYNRDRYELTSYTVNCMATDGVNIMYSSIEDSQHDLIVYCYLNVNDSKYGQDDSCRPWLVSRIVDMIWWKSIDKFVCATKDGICTVTFANKKFKIVRAIDNRSENVHVAANTNFVWVTTDEKIMIYDITFKLVRSMDFKVASNCIRRSFCITDNVVAFIVIRRDQRRSNILQVQFYDNNMGKIRSLDVGTCDGSCMIRTVEADRFIIVNGENISYLMTSKGEKLTLALGKEANCVAVINRRNIVLSKSESELQLINFKYIT
ncbi:unnamed protein product [Adineta steineri]|uniref:Uncharacterized protein n=1 Tax=Adineta steineri TaxID=433720 RepID=A0A814KCF0_9BILA|nr:unnamed protein product [Adineta steineri]CAF4108615.1 unnamed protein product [Adineta steineri]